MLNKILKKLVNFIGTFIFFIFMLLINDDKLFKEFITDIKKYRSALFIIFIFYFVFIFFEKYFFTRFKDIEFDYYLQNNTTIMKNFVEDNNLDQTNIENILENLFNKYLIESSDGILINDLNEIFEQIDIESNQKINFKIQELQRKNNKNNEDNYYNLNNPILDKKDILSFIICNILQKDNKPIDYETFNNFFMYKNKIKKFLLMQNENIDYGKEKNFDDILKNKFNIILLKINKKNKELLFKCSTSDIVSVKELKLEKKINTLEFYLSNEYFSTEEIKLIQRLSVIYYALLMNFIDGSDEQKKIKENDQLMNTFFNSNNINNEIAKSLKDHEENIKLNLNLGIYQTDIIIQILLIESILNFYFQRIIYKELFENKPDNDFYKSLKNKFFKNFIDEHSLMINNFEYLNGSLKDIIINSSYKQLDSDFLSPDIKEYIEQFRSRPDSPSLQKFHEKAKDLLDEKDYIMSSNNWFLKDIFLNININYLFNNLYDLTNKDKFTKSELNKLTNQYFFFQKMILDILEFQSLFNINILNKDVNYIDNLYKKNQQKIFNNYNEKIIYIPLINSNKIFRSLLGIFSFFFFNAIRCIKKILFNCDYYIDNKIDGKKLKFNQLIFNPIFVNSNVYFDYFIPFLFNIILGFEIYQYNNFFYDFLLPFLFKKIFNKDLSEFFYNIIIKSYLFKIIFKQIKSISFFNKVINNNILVIFINKAFIKLLEIYASTLLFTIINILSFIVAFYYFLIGKNIRFYNYFDDFIFNNFMLPFIDKLID